MASKRGPAIRELARQIAQAESSTRSVPGHHETDDGELSRPRRSRKDYGLHEGNVRMLASELDIDGTAAAAAAPRAAKILGVLKDAAACESGTEKAEHIKRAQRHMSALNFTKHGKLIQQAQARLMALQGRGGDTEVAHVTPDEIVIPPQLQTPEILSALEWATAGAGLSLDQLRVGSGTNRRNPKTGAAEFYDTINVTAPRYPDTKSYLVDGAIGGPTVIGGSGDDVDINQLNDTSARDPNDPQALFGQLGAWWRQNAGLLPQDAQSKISNIFTTVPDPKQIVNQIMGILASVGNGTTNPLLAGSPTWLQPLLNWSGYGGPMESIGVTAPHLPPLQDAVVTVPPHDPRRPPIPHIPDFPPEHPDPESIPSICERADRLKGRGLSNINSHITALRKWISEAEAGQRNQSRARGAGFDPILQDEINIKKTELAALLIELHRAQAEPSDPRCEQNT